MLNKLRLLSYLSLYKLTGVFGLKQPDIMSKINDYYRDDFRKLDSSDVAVILPHCLIHVNCPARFSKVNGVICSKCNLCNCGKISELARKKGYQFYISPSVGFTKRLIQRKNLRGVIGVACDYEIRRGIRSEKITDKGVKIAGDSIKTQGLRLAVYDCINNTVDWDKIENLIEP